MKAGEIMCRDVACVMLNETANEAARIMWECDCGIVPVIQSSDSRRLLGVITDRDVCMAAYTRGQALSEISVESAMTDEVLTCLPSDPLTSVERTMRDAQVRRLPVVDSARCLVGIVSLADIARHAGRATAAPEQTIGAREVAETLAGITLPHGAAAPA
jgi:CBS domain-containing protein